MCLLLYVGSFRCLRVGSIFGSGNCDGSQRQGTRRFRLVRLHFPDIVPLPEVCGAHPTPAADANVPDSGGGREVATAMLVIGMSRSKRQNPSGSNDDILTVTSSFAPMDQKRHLRRAGVFNARSQRFRSCESLARIKYCTSLSSTTSIFLVKH